MVAVLDEVGVPDLEQADGGQLLAPVHDLVYPPPAGAEGGLGRQKCPVEVPVAPDAADYLGDGHLAQPDVDLRDGTDGPLDLVEGEQLVGAGVPAQVSADPTQESPPAGAREVSVGLFVGIHKPLYRTNLQPIAPARSAAR